MTNKVDFRTYLYLNHNQFIIYVTKILTNEKIYSEKLEIEKNSKELKFRKLEEFLDINIFKIEKKLNNFNVTLKDGVMSVKKKL